jgi:hypothetical protein
MVVIASQKYQRRKSHTTTDFGISPPASPAGSAASKTSCYFPNLADVPVESREALSLGKDVKPH